MQFKALYHSYIFNSIDELATFIGFRAILLYFGKNSKILLYFINISKYFFLLIQVKNWSYMQFKALFKSFKTSIWNIYFVILVLKILRKIKYMINSKSRFTSCIFPKLRIKLEDCYKSQNRRVYSYVIPYEMWGIK